MYWSERFNSWLVTRYAEVVVGLRDRRLSGRRTSTFIDQQLQPDMGDLVAPLKRQLESFIGFTDPPDHTRLRKLVTAAFTWRVAEAARPRIQAVVDQLLDRVVDSGSIDLIRDVAFPAPAIVIAEFLGVPAADRDRFKPWADDFVAFITSGKLTLEIAQTAQMARGQCGRTWSTLWPSAAARAAKPGPSSRARASQSVCGADAITELLTATVVVMSVTLRRLLAGAIREIWHFVPEPPRVSERDIPQPWACIVEIQRVRSAKIRPGPIDLRRIPPRRYREPELTQ